MDLYKLFFGFDGRISREPWWAATITIVILELGFGFFANPASLSLEPSPFTMPEFLMGLAVVIPTTAITVKRFNDIGWPDWSGYAFGSFCILINLAHYYDAFGAYNEVPTNGEMAALLAVLAVYFAVLAVCGFVRGCDGPNRSGADPIAAKVAPRTQSMPNSE